MADTTGQRLDRIEEKIDRLADAMISLARAGEKIIALQDDHDNMRERMNKLSVKLDDIQKAVDSAIADSGIKDNGIIRAKGVDNTVTDQWILWGEDFSKTKKPKDVKKPPALPGPKPPGVENKVL